MKKHNFVNSSLLPSLMKMFTDCGEPEMVLPLWKIINERDLQVTSSFFSILMNAVASWAKNDAEHVTDHLKLGEEIHNHAIAANIKYTFFYINDTNLKLGGIACYLVVVSRCISAVDSHNRLLMFGKPCNGKMVW